MLLITLHHIVSDGWSMGVLTRELGALYARLPPGSGRPSAGVGRPVSPTMPSGSGAGWPGRSCKTQGDYWQRTLAGAPALLELPTDRRRPGQQDHAGAFVALELDAS